MLVIVSASRSTDVPAFYADWFMERLKAGYVKWFNLFKGLPLYVGFKKMRCIVFWSKNPAPMTPYLDDLDTICSNYYFQFTLNDYDVEGIEPRVPQQVELLGSREFLSFSQKCMRKEFEVYLMKEVDGALCLCYGNKIFMH